MRSVTSQLAPPPACQANPVTAVEPESATSRAGKPPSKATV